MVCEQEEIYPLIKESDTDFDGNHFLFDYFITSIDLSDHYAMCEVPSASINKELEIKYDEDLKEFYVTVDFSAEETGKMPLGVTDMIVVVYNSEGKQQSLKRILIKVLKKGNVLPQVTYTTHQELVETAGVAIAQVIKTPAYDHDTLRHRDYDGQHPISAITGLQDALTGKVDTTDAANKIYGTDSEGNQTTYDNPTIGNATLTIQRNGSALDTFTANATVDKVINISVPAKASDVGALPDNTKYTAGLGLSLDPSTYVLTIQLKDQDGTNIGESQTVDLPLESTVVSGSYDAENKQIVLVLQSGNTIEIPVGDLVEGLQSTITGAATTITDNDLTANKALISNAQGKVAVSNVTSTELDYVSGVTSAIQAQLNTKQGTIDDLEDIRAGASAGATALQPNTAITAGTKCKITYDTKGLVTAGADLQASDIPSLTLSKISDVTASAEELNVLEGVTASTSELNILDGVTANASELNVLDGITATTEELNYVDGVTSAIQTQLNNKQENKPDGTNPLISNNKVSNTYLPDYLLGQMLYAGAFEVLTATATLTTNAKSKLGTTDNTIVLTNDNTAITGYGANEGCFYICTSDGNFAGIALLTGDWLISTGTSWTKVDNTDAVTGVKGNAESTYRLGNVNITLDNVAPAQAGNSGKFITTDGTNTSWGSVPVEDVTVNGSSIVNNGVAIIPIAQQSGSYGLVKFGSSSSGLQVSSDTGNIAIYPATSTNLEEKTNTTRPVVSSNLDYATKRGVAYNSLTLTDAEKTAANVWLGSVKDATVDGTSIVNGTTKVAEIPVATQSGATPGLVKIPGTAYGLYINSTGFLMTYSATTTDIDSKTSTYRPVVPSNLDYAVKRGIAYNSQTLTDSEKASACSFVGALPNNIYGESTTAASTVQKEVSIPSITSLNAGQLIIVKPTTTSTVANSTLKLNDFDAYPMLYGGSAITTSTDSYVWIKDVPGWWLFDGSNWLFAGHGTDINTTYNSITLALMIAGENTTNRLIAPSILKDGTFGVVTSYASGDTITPADKYLYTSTADISALTVNTPDSPDERYVSQINFSSGTTATTFSYPNTFKVIEGCDDVQTINGVKVFVPVASKRYQMWILNDGVNTLIFAKGV